MAASLRGFTLAEVLLAVCLFAVAVLALVGVFSMSLRLGAQNRDAVQAGQLAQRLFEEIRAGSRCPAAAVTFSGAAAVNGFPPAPYPSTVVGERRYDVEVTSTPVSGVGKLYSVQTRIRWGGRHQAHFQTYFFQP
jgi:Tfp pilus assembly protein PilV